MKRRGPAINYPIRKVTRKAKRVAATKKVRQSPRGKRRKSRKDVTQQLTTHDKFTNSIIYLRSLHKVKKSQGVDMA